MPFITLRGRPGKIGVADGQLNACPSSPNCVCSDSRDTAHSVEPLELAVEAAAAWAVVTQSVQSLRRVRIVSETENYLHAECSSRLLGFVDDLELHLRPADGIIAVRSASRLGYSDFGVNRRRVEKLRTSLRARNILR